MHDDIFIVPVVFGAFAFVSWGIISGLRRYKIAKLQAEVQTRLLDRFASSQDLLAFSQTEPGKQMLESLRVERSTAYSRIIVTVQSSIVMLLLGGAMFFLRSRVFDAAEEFTVFGTLITTLGAGLGISSAVSYILSKSFGLLGGNGAAAG
jgi:hypothetical protein